MIHLVFEDTAYTFGVINSYVFLGGLFGEKIVDVLLNNLRSTSEQDRIAGLIVATYLLNSSNSILKPKITELISVLHKLLNESSTKVKCSTVLQ